MPEGQTVQSACWTPLVVPLYVPAAQAVGVVVASGQYSPAGQGRQAEGLLLLTAGLYVPGVQLVGLTDWRGQ